VLHKVVDLCAEDRAGLFGEESPKTRRTAPKEGAVLYQFKITLLHTKPPIWRRIQVLDCTLADLHEYIQAAFGWENYHLHLFEIDGERYSQSSEEGDDFNADCKDEMDVLLSKLIPTLGRRSRWIYEYDFGDYWRHEVLFEGFPPSEPKAKYPLCLEGDRACPMEDCGGPRGYADYVAAIANPKHEQHEEMLKWRGPFDPEAFDAKKATSEMRKVM
jgi:Plasmid pRiA4b ORF-3-like protein